MAAGRPVRSELMAASVVSSNVHRTDYQGFQGNMAISALKLVSWNLNGRRPAAQRQVDAVARRQPDIVAFQEVTEGTIGILRRALIERGLPFALNSFELQESRSRLTGPCRYGLLIAGRMPLEPVL